MHNVAPISEIKGFVRTKLGCNCPDEVFSDIEFRQHVRIPNCQMDVTRILVGQRLLVFVVFAEKDTDLRYELPEVIVYGKRERDQCGLNRFRLVVAADSPETIHALAYKAYRNSRVLDEKIHLHVVSSDDVAQFY